MSGYLVLFFGLMSCAFAGIPSLSVVKDGRRQDVEVEKVNVEVHVEGGFAKTSVTMDFFNATNLNQEGEFVLPLPDGATVSDYALEVKGWMRKATVVEKERAIRAYEEIKAKNIDPGIVTREVGNVYRTRIFPIEPKKSKRVTVGYVEEMKVVDGKFVYELPFDLNEGDVKVIVTGDFLEVKGPKGLKMTSSDEGFTGEAKDTSVKGMLLVHQDDEKDIARVFSVGEERFVHFSGMIPKRVLEAKAKKPESVRLLWDGSAGGYSRDLEKEFSVLDAFFKELGDVQVSLDIVDLSVKSHGDFVVKNGNWKDVRKILESVEYDGVADWGKVNWSKMNEDRVIVVGAERVFFPIKSTRCRSVLHVLSSAKVADAHFHNMSVQSGGRVMNLNSIDERDVVRELIMLRPRVMKVKGVSDVHSWERNGCLTWVGKFQNKRKFSVVYGIGMDVVLEQSVSVEQELTGGEIIRRAWSQKELASIEGVEGDKEVIDFCKKYHLVSDLTAMIVLERFEDHVKYEIPPPEEELLEKYEEAVQWVRAGKAFRNENPFVGEDPFVDGDPFNIVELPFLFKRRVLWAWYKTDYPWMEAMLFPKYQRVKEWVNAQGKVFSKKELAVTNQKVFINWMKGVADLSQGRKLLKNQEDFKRWKLDLDRLIKEEKNLATASLIFPNTKFGISVRGLVSEPCLLYTSPSPRDRG